MVKSYIKDKNGRLINKMKFKNGTNINTFLIDGVCFYREYIQSIESATCTHGTYTIETAADGRNINFSAPNGDILKYQYRTEANNRGPHRWVDQTPPTRTETVYYNPAGEDYVYCALCGKYLGASGYNNGVLGGSGNPNAHTHKHCRICGEWR